jgi:hypothetical protein
MAVGGKSASTAHRICPGAQGSKRRANSGAAAMTGLKVAMNVPIVAMLAVVGNVSATNVAWAGD